MKVSELGEDAFIARLLSHVPLDPGGLTRPGDDCAVVNLGDVFRDYELLKTDAIVEGIHFTRDALPEEIGWKAIARVISDFGAMGGGEPKHFMVTLALSPDENSEWVERIYSGMANCMKRFGGFIVGGETVSVPPGSAAVISISATGYVFKDNLTLRNGASPGDLIMVTGFLGGSRTGKHLNFSPRNQAAQWLADYFKPTAMMDISDGLGVDVVRMANASNCSYGLSFGDIPVTKGCTLEQAIFDGEDYELLFTISPDRLDALESKWSKHHPNLRLTHIGMMLDQDEASANLNPTKGWDHFQNNNV